MSTNHFETTTVAEWAFAAERQIDCAGNAHAEGKHAQRDLHIARANTYAQLATVRALNDLVLKLNEIYHAIAEGK